MVKASMPFLSNKEGPRRTGPGQEKESRPGKGEGTPSARLSSSRSSWKKGSGMTTLIQKGEASTEKKRESEGPPQEATDPKNRHDAYFPGPGRGKGSLILIQEAGANQ